MNFEEARTKFFAEAMSPAVPARPESDGHAAIPGREAVTLYSLRSAIPRNQAIPEERRQYGTMAFRTFCDSFLETTPLHKQLVTESCNRGVFSPAGMNRNCIKMYQLLALGRLGKANALPTRAANRSSHYQTLALAEGFGPYVANEWKVPQREAHQEIIEAVRWLMTEEGEDIAGLSQDEWLNMETIGLPAELLEHAERWDIDHALVYLEAMAVAVPSNQHWLNGLSFVTTAISSICRRGTISDEHRVRIVSGVKDATSGANIYLPQKTVERFFRMYGENVNSYNAGGIMDYYKTLVSQNVIALRNLIIQAAGSGLTTYVTILRALAAYQDFTWSRVAVMAPQDFQAIDAAMQTIQGNLYFGFNAQMSVAAARRFPTLSYCAFQLCIRVGGDQPLMEYKGQPRSIPNKPAIDALLDAFVEARAGVMENLVVSQEVQDRVNRSLENARASHLLMEGGNNLENAGPSSRR